MTTPQVAGGNARFVEKHEVRGLPPGCLGVPLGARERNVRPIVFGRAHRFCDGQTERSLATTTVAVPVLASPASSVHRTVAV